jgi:hypothetical protein
MDDAAKRRVEEWRRHPNYRQFCGADDCYHAAIFHKNGEGKCEYPGCPCGAFSRRQPVTENQG